MSRDPVRLALIDSIERQSAIEMIAGALRSAYSLSKAHQFGGTSPDTLWRLLNGIGPRGRN